MTDRFSILVILAAAFLIGLGAGVEIAGGDCCPYCGKPVAYLDDAVSVYHGGTYHAECYAEFAGGGEHVD